MKKFIFKVFLVIGFTSISYSLILFLGSFFDVTNWLPNAKTNTGGYGHTLLRLREAEKISNTELLVIGSSHAYRGFDPRIFQRHGIEMFNLGTSSQTPMNSYYLLEEHLPKMKPKYVVLELYWKTLMSDGVEPTIDIISNNDLNEDIVEMSLANENALAFHCLASAALSRIHTPITEAKQIDLVDEYISGGFTESTLKKNKLSNEELRSIPPQKITLDTLQLEYLHKTIALCNKFNAKLLFVVAPVTQELYSKTTNYSFYRKFIFDISKKNQLLFFDYNNHKDLKLSSFTDFYDTNHLTQQGVLKFNKKFIDDLRRTKLLNKIASDNPVKVTFNNQ